MGLIHNNLFKVVRRHSKPITKKALVHTGGTFISDGRSWFRKDARLLLANNKPHCISNVPLDKIFSSTFTEKA